MAHVEKVCYGNIDADNYTLAHLLQNPEQKAQYFYDFGDRWMHEIHAEKILPKEESDGSVVLLEGRGMCPPEDHGKGNRNWAKDIWIFRHRTTRGQIHFIRAALSATNYKYSFFTRADFEPCTFLWGKRKRP
ncbi:hypothetical protein OE88DRAFT_1733989 [Heliocybe sulcata]|uniref:Plasmid pRiA4b Orf3-like domain-containing protein n=1 Tax=Heliocybe sulcata TaxID=5364 RepID=A0A5C3NAN1_9AGAM|nr:hypothetical protein OE88DRAFT_1733989 [Heliocybe sulcata]